MKLHSDLCQIYGWSFGKKLMTIFLHVANHRCLNLSLNLFCGEHPAINEVHLHYSVTHFSMILYLFYLTLMLFFRHFLNCG